jgi:hypothetical protein
LTLTLQNPASDSYASVHESAACMGQYYCTLLLEANLQTVSASVCGHGALMKCLEPTIMVLVVGKASYDRRVG